VVIALGVIGAATGAGDDGDDSDAIATVASTVEPPGTSSPRSDVSNETAGGAASPTTEEPPPRTTEAPPPTEPPTTPAPPTTEAPTTTTTPPTTRPPTTTAPTTTTLPPTTLPSIPTFGGGVQLLGADIQPGVYLSPGARSFNCYFERLSGLSGDFSEILANGNSDGQVIVEILPSDVAFSSTGCEDWVAFLGASPVETFTDGDWVVGQHITPGRWQTEGEPGSFGCYWERSSGFTHEFDEILGNANTEGRTIVDVSASDRRFTASGCGTWSRIG
jgi:hypothetical protein